MNSVTRGREAAIGHERLQEWCFREYGHWGPFEVSSSSWHTLISCCLDHLGQFQGYLEHPRVDSEDVILSNPPFQF